MKGHVQIYEEDKLIYEHHNLVVTAGRQVLQHRLLGQGVPNGVSYANYRLTHFGIGVGGTDPVNPLVPNNPDTSDTELASPLQLGPSYPGLNKKEITTITHLDSTTTLLELHIDTTDVVAPTSIYYNEAGLYATAPDFSIDRPNNFILVARITFPSVIKNSQRSQKLFWYLFF